jgi:hypothetical protein
MAESVQDMTSTRDSGSGHLRLSESESSDRRDSTDMPRAMVTLPNCRPDSVACALIVRSGPHAKIATIGFMTHLPFRDAGSRCQLPHFLAPANVRVERAARGRTSALQAR